jgi:hypothetical protein
MHGEPKSYAQEHATGTGTDSKAHAKAVSRIQRFERLQNLIPAIHDVRSHSGVGAFDILRAEFLRQNRVMVGRQPLALGRRIVEPVEDQDLIPFNGHAQGGISAALRNPHVKPEMRLVNPEQLVEIGLIGRRRRIQGVQMLSRGFGGFGDRLRNFQTLVNKGGYQRCHFCGLTAVSERIEDFGR